MKATYGPITDLFYEYASIGDFCLTKRGSLVGAVEIDGRDSEGLSSEDFTALSMISRSILLNLPEYVSTLTQYYVHIEDARISLKERPHPIINFLSRNREEFLNRQEITSSKIFHFFEVEPDQNLTDLSFFTLCKHLVLAFKGDRVSRTILGKYVSSTEAIVAYEEDLKKQRSNLDEVLLDVKGRWETLFSARIVPKKMLWAFMRLMGNLNPTLFYDSLEEEVPKEQWDLLISGGDCSSVMIDNRDFLKFSGIDSTYARILSVIRYGEDFVMPGIWSSDKSSPTRQKGNYVIMNRFSPLSRIRQAMMFGERRRELERRNRGLGEMFEIVKTGATVGGDRYSHLKPQIKEKILELEKAEALGERWGECQAAVMVFGENPHKINETARQLIKGMHQAGMGVVTESVNLPDAYRAMLPAGKHFSIRNMDLNCSQFGAATMIYRSSEGQVAVDDLRGEEAQYIFTCADGNLFHFSPFVSGRAVVICVGPIRTGKSFFRNTVASHFVKYGGFYRAIDIDPGTETLALFFREDGAIFRVGQGNRGFNNFELAAGSDDMGFVMHQKALVIEMLKSNENAAMRTLESHEQYKLDQAIIATLRLPKQLRRLSTMVNHCPPELSQKLNRWYGNGMYASLFDCENDAVGKLDKKVVAFNLSEIKGDSVLLPLAMHEITYRITRAFETPEYRSIPKFLDIDEAHAMLSIKSMRDYIIRNVRTWGKWQSGIGLWSQDPSEFMKIEDWTALRSAASTFIFMADPTADKDLYKNAFNVTDGELEEIRRMKPKKEAYIIQRDIAVSKKIVVDVEPEQYCINTSRPDEATLRDQLVTEHGIEAGLQRTIEALNLREKETV